MLYQFYKIRYQGGEPQTVRLVRQGEPTQLGYFVELVLFGRAAAAVLFGVNQ